MSQETGQSEMGERKTLPIEEGFPIELVNDLSEKENYGGARQHYRPIYTMHKWWAPRTGAVFRTICLYSLLDNPENVDVREPGANQDLSSFSSSESNVEQMIEDVSIDSPDSLWPLYGKDVQIKDKTVLDPFMGGGTSLGEASRLGAEVVGNDLNPVSWFIVKKIFDGAEADVNKLTESYNIVKDAVSEEILNYYRTPCPNSDHDADVISYFWAKELDCVACGETVGLFNDYRVGKGRYGNDDKYHVYCPECESVVLVDDWRSEQECSCGHSFTPEHGTVSGSQYSCRECGQEYSITDAVQEQDGYDHRLYGIEFYCPTCDENSKKFNYNREDYKSYKTPEKADFELYSTASKEWDSREDLSEYVPDEEIRRGAKTESSSIDGSDLFAHGYTKWKELFNKRQLLCLSKLLKAIDNIDNEEAREYLLLAFSDSLRLNSLMTIYHHSNNQSVGIFKSNSFDPPIRPLENNLWGTKYGSGTFHSMWEMVMKGVRYAKSPTERIMIYPEDESPSEYAPTDSEIDSPNVVETKEFARGLSSNADIRQGDMRRLSSDEEFDAVITDPPYYDNIIYSELSDYFYVWQKIILEDEYKCFESPQTPRTESIVANPAEGKGEPEFEDEIKQAFRKIRELLTEDGVLAFTYHHSSSESWGEVLEALCDAGFEVTATYPVSADLSKLSKGQSVQFDIIIVARPSHSTDPISWNSLRREIYRTAKRTRKNLEENRKLSQGDIGVVEMGRCFHEYSKHHGKVKRAGKSMNAKEVVKEIYGIIQHGRDIGEIDVFLDLLETPNPSFNDLNKLSRGTDATPERMEDMTLYQMDNKFKLGTWKNQKRIAYIQSRIEKNEELNNLDKAQFLRYRWEHGKSITEYLSEWEITDDLRELCEGLADATGDETYRNILESRLDDFS